MKAMVYWIAHLLYVAIFLCSVYVGCCFEKIILIFFQCKHSQNTTINTFTEKNPSRSALSSLSLSPCRSSNLGRIENDKKVERGTTSKTTGTIQGRFIASNVHPFSAKYQSCICRTIWMTFLRDEKLNIKSSRWNITLTLFF